MAARVHQTTLSLAPAKALAFLLAALLCRGVVDTASAQTVPNASEGSATPLRTRAELLEQARQEKAQSLASPQPEWWEKFFKSYDRKGSQSIEDSNLWGFHPRIDWIARGSGAAAGVRYWRPEILGPLDLMGAAYYSWRRYQLYDIQFGIIPNRGKRLPDKTFGRFEVEHLGNVDQQRYGRFKLYGSASFLDRTDDSFYGLGTQSKREERVRYRLKESSLEAVTGYQFGRHFGWTFRAAALNYSLGPGRSAPSFGEIDTLEDPPGLDTPPNFVRIHNSFLFDFRDNPGNAHSGWMVAFGWEHFNNVNTSDEFNFHRFGLDARGYVPLGSHQRVLALRGVFVNSDPAKENQIPFYLQPSLGGGESLRAYDAYRFQGDKMMLLQVEYRWEATRAFELALFGDTGTVAQQGEHISLDKLKSDWGFGVRFKTSRSTLFRVDQAFGNEGPRTQFRFSTVF